MDLFFDIDSDIKYSTEEGINESSGKTEKKYKIKGIFSTIGEMNRNKRSYPLTEWQREVNKYQENFKNGSTNLLMEWEHPPRTAVDPMKAVAKIESLKIDGKYVLGEAVLLDNPQANQIKSLIDNGIKISVSSRGVGNVNNGVVSNFKLITYDIVPDPSDYNAVMNGMVESYQLNEGILQDKTFDVDNNGNIFESKNEDKLMFTKKEFAQAINEKFNSILNIFRLKGEEEKTELAQKKLDYYKEEVKKRFNGAPEELDDKTVKEIFVLVNEALSDFLNLLSLQNMDLSKIDPQDILLKIESKFSVFADLNRFDVFLREIVSDLKNYATIDYVFNLNKISKLTPAKATDVLDRLGKVYSLMLNIF